MQSPNKGKFVADSKPTYTYDTNVFDPVSVPLTTISHAYNNYVTNVSDPVSVPLTTISHAYNNYVTGDQLQNGNDDEVFLFHPETDDKPTPTPPAYTYNMNGINVSDPVPVSFPFTPISHAYNNYVTDDQLQNGNMNNDRIENDDEVFRLTEEYFNSFPSGYRFVPTDIELINSYLTNKLDNLPLPLNKMHEFNLYKYSPENISRKYTHTCEKEGKKMWYIFSPRDKKYPKGDRPNRAASTGYWKATGADKKISLGGQLIGFKKSLVFYEGKAPKGEKTNWIMHEFRVNAEPRQKTSADDMRLDNYVLCRIYKKGPDKNKQNNNNELPNNNELWNNNELKTDGNCSSGYCQQQIPTCSLPINCATPTATVATLVSSMPVSDAAATTTTVVPDSTASASGDIQYSYSSSPQMFTSHEFDYVDGKLFDNCFYVNDFYCQNSQYKDDVGNDCSPAKLQKKD